MERRFLFLFFVILFVANGCTSRKNPVTPETALWSYLHNGDKTFDWKITDQIREGDISLFQVVFTSQKWRGITWRHELTLVVPDQVNQDEALLFITGGSVKNEQPNLHKWDDGLIRSIGQIAEKNQAITSIIWQVPNQPLYNDRTEDELISYTLHEFQKDSDFTWPLLFPMTKSAIRAMDVIQEFSDSILKKKVNQFVVSGASKRGWTTWLTGATDPRVKAIAPMVIDVLNMPVNISYQKELYGDYSVQIEDFVKLGLAQQMSSGGGKDLVDMIDPYSYRKNLTMPKMIFMGTNDEYWTVDAVKNYIDIIPGNNHICYIPNAGHGMGDKKQALNTLSAFFATTITDSRYADCKYTLAEGDRKIKLTVGITPELISGAALWSADSADRDFRDETWSSTNLPGPENAQVHAELICPEAGFKAFYIELKYKAPVEQEYTECTRMFVAGKDGVLY